MHTSSHSADVCTHKHKASTTHHACHHLNHTQTHIYFKILHHIWLIQFICVTSQGLLNIQPSRLRASE